MLRRAARRAANQLVQRASVSVSASSLFHKAKLSTSASQGKDCLKALLVDGAGTVGDPFSEKPGVAFVKAFAQKGVNLTWEEATKPMGKDKLTHCKEIFSYPRVIEEWKRVYGREPNLEVDAKEIYAATRVILSELLRTSTSPIPGWIELVNSGQLPSDLIIALHSAYNAEDLQTFREEMLKHGAKFASAKSTTTFKNGRPHCATLDGFKDEFGIFAWQAVVMDDSASGVAAGRNGDYWVIGAAVYGTLTGIRNLQEAYKMPAHELKERREEAAKKLYAAGAHYVVKEDYVLEIPRIIADINSRLAAKCRPSHVSERAESISLKM